MKKHAIIVPTHRVIDQRVINSLIKEQGIAKNKYEMQIPIFIYSDANSEVYSKNEELIAKFRDIYHFERNMIYNVAEFIASNCGVSSEILFNKSKETNSYAKIFNMMFLIGIAFGTGVFHRRDSDVVIQQILGKDIAPIEIELQYMQSNENECSMIGSAYVGKPNFQFDDCMKTSEFFTLFYKAMGIEDENIINKIIRKNQKVDKDFFKEDSVIKSGGPEGMIDCGNVCFCADIYYRFPNICLDKAVAVDYFVFNTAEIIENNTLAHSRKLQHIHSNERLTESAFMRYWQNIYYFIDMTVLYGNLLNIVFEYKENAVHYMKTYLSDELQNNISLDERLKKLSLLSEALKKTGNTKYMEIARKSERNSFNDIIEYTNKGFDDYNILLTNWDKIIHFTEVNNTRIKEILRN